MSKVVINTMYFPPKYTNNKGRFGMEVEDVLIATVMDETTGERFLDIKPQPEVSFFKTISDSYTYPKICIDKNLVERYTCKYNKRKFELAKSLGLETEYLAMKQQPYEVFSDWYKKKIENSPFLFQADIDIEDHYKFYFEKYNPREATTMPKFKKAHLDIEADQFGFDGVATGQNPLVPVNLIQYITDWDKKIYIFVLENNGQENNPDFQEIKNNPLQFISEEVYSDTDYDGETTVQLFFYKTEEQMFTAFWHILHITKPDFCGIWNINFDIPYLLRRANYLGMDVASLVCHPDVPTQYMRVEYKEDNQRATGTSFTGAKKHPALLWDWVSISGYTQFYDQMSMYANLRKRTQEDSYKLDDVGEKELKIRKVSLEDYGLNIRTVAHKNFRHFLKYGIKDVYILMKLEEKLEDVDKFVLATGNTRLQKGVNISYVIKNLLMKQFDREDKIIGNNVMYDTWENVSGAIVAAPQLLDLQGLSVLGQASFIFDHTVDLDASSEYPNIMIAFNIAKSTIVYRMIKIVNSKTNQVVGTGEQLNKMLQTRRTSSLDIGQKFLNLPCIGDLMDKINAGAL